MKKLLFISLTVILSLTIILSCSSDSDDFSNYTEEEWREYVKENQTDWLPYYEIKNNELREIFEIDSTSYNPIIYSLPFWESNDKQTFAFLDIWALKFWAVTKGDKELSFFGNHYLSIRVEGPDKEKYIGYMCNNLGIYYENGKIYYHNTHSHIDDIDTFFDFLDNFSIITQAP